MSSQSVILCVRLVVVCDSHPPYGEDTVDIIPHPSVILGPPWGAILVQESWEEASNRVLKHRQGGKEVLNGLTIINFISLLNT